MIIIVNQIIIINNKSGKKRGLKRNRLLISWL